MLFILNSFIICLISTFNSSLSIPSLPSIIILSYPPAPGQIEKIIFLLSINLSSKGVNILGSISTLDSSLINLKIFLYFLHKSFSNSLLLILLINKFIICSLISFNFENNSSSNKFFIFLLFAYSNTFLTKILVSLPISIEIKQILFFKK